MGHPVRIIKKKDGKTVTHSGASVTAESLPPNMSEDDIESHAFYADADEVAPLLADAECDEQVSIQNGKVVLDKSKKSRRRKIKDKADAADALLDGLEDDTALGSSVRPYLIAIRDLLQRGKSKIN